MVMTQANTLKRNKIQESMFAILGRTTKVDVDKHSLAIPDGPPGLGEKDAATVLMMSQSKLLLKTGTKQNGMVMNMDTMSMMSTMRSGKTMSLTMMVRTTKASLVRQTRCWTMSSMWLSMTLATPHTSMRRIGSMTSEWHEDFSQLSHWILQLTLVQPPPKCLPPQRARARKENLKLLSMHLVFDVDLGLIRRPIALRAQDLLPSLPPLAQPSGKLWRVWPSKLRMAWWTSLDFQRMGSSSRRLIAPSTLAATTAVSNWTVHLPILSTTSMAWCKPLLWGRNAYAPWTSHLLNFTNVVPCLGTCALSPGYKKQIVDPIIVEPGDFFYWFKRVALNHTRRVFNWWNGYWFKRVALNHTRKVFNGWWILMYISIMRTVALSFSDKPNYSLVSCVKSQSTTHKVKVQVSKIWDLYFNLRLVL